jgi:hypothetical protein
MPKTKAAKKEQGHALGHEEERIEENKYFVPFNERVTGKKKEFDFPRAYGDNRIVLLVRDPHWIFSYWELTQKKYDEVKNTLGGDFERSKEILRVYDQSAQPWKSFDITVSYGTKNWYINVPAANSTYIVDIGFLTPDGKFNAMARSNAVTTPRDGMSDVIDEEWMVVDFDRIYALSGGFGIGKSSGEIREMMKKHLLEMRASGWVSSPSSPFGRRPK